MGIIKNINFVDEIPNFTEQLDEMPEKLSLLPYSENLKKRFNNWYSGRYTYREYSEMRDYVKEGMDIMEDLAIEEQILLNKEIEAANEFLIKLGVISSVSVSESPCPKISKSKGKKKKSKKKVAQPLKWC